MNRIKLIGLVSLCLATLLNADVVKVKSHTKAAEELLKPVEQVKIVKLQDKVTKNCENIKVLKIAVAKLIKEVNNLKNQKPKVIVKKVYVTKPVVKFKRLPPVKKPTNQMAKNIQNTIQSTEALNNKKEEYKNICTTKYKRVLNLKKLRQSFKPLKPRKFTVLFRHIKIYKYPFLGAPVIGDMYYKDHFIGDMFTYSGWVHVKTGGWVRGFKVSPKILYHKEKMNPNDTAMEVKKIVSCHKVKKTIWYNIAFQKNTGGKHGE